MRELVSSVALVLVVGTIAIAVPSVADPQPVPNIAASSTPNGADGLTLLKGAVSVNRHETES